MNRAIFLNLTRMAYGLRKNGGPLPVRRFLRPRNFLSVKVFRMDLEADFRRLFVVGFVC
jgi:hypothetical protein